jgi:hypothetical protein
MLVECIPDNTDIPLCKNCKHFSRSWMPILLGDYEYGRCQRPTGSVTINVITGKKYIKKLHAYATNERIGGPCGPQGNYWFSDKKKHLFTMLKRS